MTIIRTKSPVTGRLPDTGNNGMHKRVQVSESLESCPVMESPSDEDFHVSVSVSSYSIPESAGSGTRSLPDFFVCTGQNDASVSQI